jgi:hypothetical protein
MRSRRRREPRRAVVRPDAQRGGRIGATRVDQRWILRLVGDGSTLVFRVVGGLSSGIMVRSASDDSPATLWA